jgi:DNA-binding protein YbaB
VDPLGPIDANPLNTTDPDQWIRDMDARIADYQKKSADLADSLARSTATVTSNDSAVTVTISPTGALQNIELGPRAGDMSPAQLTAAIMATVRKGQRKAAGNVIEAFAPLAAGTESMDFVMQYLPPPADDEEDEDSDKDLYADDEPADEPPARQPSANYPPMGMSTPPVAPPARPNRPARPQPDDDEEEDGLPW